MEYINMTRIEPVYCTPEDVAETLDLPDPNDHYGTLQFTDLSHPSYARVCKMIKSNEDIIDRTVRRTWRENQVKNQVLTIETYWHDVNAFRQDYYSEGGNFVQLRKNVLKWDPSKGDKLEYKTRSNVWIDVTNTRETTFEPVSQQEPGIMGGVGYGFWFDYNLGKLYLRTSAFQNLAHSVRITYRYGEEVPLVTETVTDPETEEESEVPVENEFGMYKVDRDAIDVPSGINRMCCLMTAIQILNMQFFNVRVGTNGDIGSARDSAIKNWTDEINMLKTSYQRSGSVHSLLR